MEVKLSFPDITEQEASFVLEALRSGWLAHGPFNHKLEEEFVKVVGTKHAITCNSCTSALFLCVKALGITGEVILPSFSFVATANAIVTTGATPVFVDIDPRTFNIDPALVEKAITERTQAIMPVHYAGQCADMKALMSLARQHKLLIIEDSAETLGGTFEGKQAGSFGLGCFSFFPTKNITSGEGGMITTDDDKLAHTIRALLAHGIDSTTFEREKKETPWYRNASYAGYNFRLSNVLAAIGYAQILRLEELNSQRKEHAAYLLRQLKDVAWLELPFIDTRCEHVFQMFVIRVKDPVRRDSIVRELNKKGVKASVHFYPAIHEQAYYQKHFGRYKNKLPVTEKVSRSIITLPMFPGLQREELEYMVETIRQIN